VPPLMDPDSGPPKPPSRSRHGVPMSPAAIKAIADRADRREPYRHEVLRKMIKEEAIALQAVVDEILALAVEKRSEIGGTVNWGDLLCLDVEVSLLDGIVTVTVEGAAPEAVELCRFVSEELARRGYSGIAVRTEW